MINRTELIVTRSVIVAGSLAILAWAGWSFATNQTVMLALVLGVIGALAVTVFPALMLVRYVPRLVRAIRAPRS